jgi:hypothetical protein
MKIDNPKYFKITIEDVNFQTINGKEIIVNWTGYGKIFIPFYGWTPIVRRTRPAVYMWQFKKKAILVDVREYLRQNFKR